MAKRNDDPTMTDEALAELLEERGHTGSATALRQKLVAAAAVAATCRHRRRRARSPTRARGRASSGATRSARTE